MKRVVLLGSTGSIGVNALKVIQEHSQEFEVVGLAAGRRVELLAEQARAFKPKAVAIREASLVGQLKGSLNGICPRILAGEQGVAELAAMDGVDQVIVAITGAAALRPTLAAIERGRLIGLANKETLVMAGELVMRKARERGAVILPIDSEHSAIFQCLRAGECAEAPGEASSSRSQCAEVRKIWLTTSGGPLRKIPSEEFSRLSKAQVMDHPRWKMGPKITVDSATMMNKALEVIEARWLFGLPESQVEVVVHPEAIVHSLVEFIDGSVLAQLAVTDMRLPIQYALTYPGRLSSALPALDLVGLKQLTFEAPDRSKFPCLGLGYEAARTGGTLPAVLNAANEVCVAAFLKDELPFTRVAPVIEKVLRKHRTVADPTLEEIMDADRWARREAQNLTGSGTPVPDPTRVS